MVTKKNKLDNKNNLQICRFEDRKMKSLKIVDDILSYIELSNDFEQSFGLGQWCASFLSNNKLGVYRDDRIEELLAEKLTAEYTNVDYNSGSVKYGELHIASEIYKHGGHTRIIESLAHTAKVPISLLLSRSTKANNAIKYIDSKNIKVLRLQAKSHREAVNEVFNIASKFETIFMHIHFDDVVVATALALIRRKYDKKIIVFVNHGDHSFSVGLSSASFVYELSSYGWALREKRGTVAISSFIGIPISANKQFLTDGNRKDLIISAGSSIKYKPSLGVSMPNTIILLLNAIPSANVVIIGPKPLDYWWWYARIKYKRRLIILPRIAHPEYLKIINTASVYLDSIPFIGGTAFTEALLNGLSVTGILSNITGYGYADMLLKKSHTDLIDAVQKLLSYHSISLKEQDLVRSLANIYHSPINVRSRIEKTIKTSQLNQPPQEFNVVLPPVWFEKEWFKSSIIKSGSFVETIKIYSNSLVLTRIIFKNVGLKYFLLLIFIARIFRAKFSSN